MPFKYLAEKIGGCGAGSAITGGCTMIGVGIWLWVDYAWKAMAESKMNDDAPYAKYLITFIPPGAYSFVALSALAGACALGCIGMVVGACWSATDSNDLTKEMKENTPDTIIKKIVGEQNFKKLAENAPKIDKILEGAFKLKEEGKLDNEAINTIADQLLDINKAIIPPTQHENLRKAFKDRLEGTMASHTIAMAEQAQDQIRANPSYFELTRSYMSNARSKARNLLGSFRPAPKSTLTPSSQPESTRTFTV